MLYMFGSPMWTACCSENYTSQNKVSEGQRILQSQVNRGTRRRASLEVNGVCMRSFRYLSCAYNRLVKYLAPQRVPMYATSSKLNLKCSPFNRITRRHYVFLR